MMPTTPSPEGTTLPTVRLMNPTLNAAHRYTKTRVATGQIATSTAREEGYTLAQFAREMGSRHLDRLARRDIERWLAAIGYLAANTRRTRWSTVRAFLEWCVMEGLVRRHPMSGMRAPRAPRVVHRALAPDQSRALLAACHDERDALLVELGLQVGLRRKELAGLEVADVDLYDATVTVVGKGGHERRVPLSTPAVHALRRYLRGRPWLTAGPLFRQDRYPARGVTPHWVGLRVARIATEAGVKVAPGDGVGTHSLRHSAATDMHRLGADVVAIQEVLGHENLNTTQIYVRSLGVERLRSAVEGRDYRASSPEEAAG